MSDTPGAPDWHAVLAIATLVAVAATGYQIHDSVTARRAQTYLELRKEFLAIDKDLDAVDRGVPYPENDACPQSLVLKRYWYFTESEWKLAQIDSSLLDAWNNSQRPQVIKGLAKPSYRSTYLIFKKRADNTEGVKFSEDIDGTYPNDENQKSIDDSLKRPMCALTEKQKREREKNISDPELSASACQCSASPGKALVDEIV
jgi:hypothetical protein